ncbi:MAG: ATP-binding cassette domain-containing protein [Candidatus Competibacterales bacterium]|nr:ATP-binding cassette domain-containing protein [Candidatus Competibacterales bacterium]
MTVAPVLCAEGLTRRFATRGRQITALDQVDLTFGPGLTALVGTDGAGKTTLLRLAAGLLRPDSGRLRVLNLDPLTEATALHRRSGYMPQRFGLYRELGVIENLRLYADLAGLPLARQPQRLTELLELAGLERFRDRLAGHLSGGMQQKLALICTLLREPELLLLDEPTVGIDPVSRQELWHLFETLVHEHGLALVFSTAYMGEAGRSDHIAILHQGRVLASDSPDRYKASVRNRCVTVSAAGQNRRRLQRRLLRSPAVIDAVIAGTDIRVVLRDGHSPRAPELDGVNLTPRMPRFEDAFVALLDKAGAGGQPPALDDGTPPNTTDGEPVVTVSGLGRRFGDFEAVRDLGFEIRRGEIFGLLGANGAGKTTTFRMLCGLLPPTSGHLQVAGVDLRRAAAEARARIGYVAQHFALYRNLSVRQNLRFFAGAYRLRGQHRRERMEWAAHTFDLATVLDQDAGDLPLGYQQRLSLACALMHEPEILFLDEPTSGVDPLARREFWSSINTLAERGVTVLITTHFLEEADYCDRLVIMADGGTLAAGTPAAVKCRALPKADTPPSMEQAFIALVRSRKPAP